jgi:hypothetical protein
MKRGALIFLLVIAVLSVLLSGCLSKPTPQPALETAEVKPSSTPSGPSIITSPTSPPAPLSTNSWYTGERLSPFTADQERAIPPVRPSEWREVPYQGDPISLPLLIDQIANPAILEGLTPEQVGFLLKNGFVAIHSQEAQFSDVRKVGKIYGQPYFQTTDHAFHALHLLFDDLLKALELQYFHPRLLSMTDAALTETLAYLALMQGSPIEEDVRLAAAYLSVGLKLLDPHTQINPAVAGAVTGQVMQVMEAGGRAESILLPGFEDDYGAYKPAGHYAGNLLLEGYFRALTWFGRVHFELKDADQFGKQASRAPLVITLALRRGRVGSESASQVWSGLHEDLTFLIGPTDDAGPLEYAALMDEIYGDSATIHALADEELWQDFLRASDRLPVPQIHSTFADSTDEMQLEKGWRFMGQRFTLDGYIFQSLIFDQVKPRSGERRLLPTGLDVMAALGSSAAMETLSHLGDTKYPNYLEQMDMLKAAATSQPEVEWLGRFYDSWLYAFFPVVAVKGDAYPPFMQTQAWGYKDLNTSLGSWAELKHDTVLYTKMPESLAGGGPPSSGPAPAYIEPNPEVFYRLSAMAETLANGFEFRQSSSDSPALDDVSLQQYLAGMRALAERFRRFGDIAARQLNVQPLDESDLEMLHWCLGLNECLSEETPSRTPSVEMPPVPVVAAVSGAEDQILQVGVGGVDRLYVIIPWDGRLEVAQGGVFSYYEFPQPRSQRLTDQEWRELLAGGEPPPLPTWTGNFVLQGGGAVDNTAFRIGDVYLITEEGHHLNVRTGPSRQNPIMGQFEAGEYLEIIDGPVNSGGYTWWKVRPAGYMDESYAALRTGWAVEHQEWYARAYGQ